MSILEQALAVDLGTSNTRVFAKGRGLIYNEPSVVAVGQELNGRKKILAIGSKAKEMIGRTPDKIKAVRPLKNGVIADYEIAQSMLRMIVAQAGEKFNFLKPKILICVPQTVTAVERRAVEEAAQAAGAKEVSLMAEPLAAAIGAGLPVSAPVGSFIIDLGGGTTEIALVALNGIIHAQSVRIGGKILDEHIINLARRELNILIGEQTAEEIKQQLVNLDPEHEVKELTISGRDLVRGIPKSAKISSDHVSSVVADDIDQIISKILLALEETPPELSADLYEYGLTLCGGSALIKGLPEKIHDLTGLEVIIARNPGETIINGAGELLNQFDYARELMRDAQ